MSLRRKIALWLCPELVVPVVEPILPSPHAQHMGSAEAWVKNISAIAEWNKEYGGHSGERVIHAANNRGLFHALKASQHASDAAWKAEVLEQLKAMNATLNRVVEGGNTMVVNGVQKTL